MRAQSTSREIENNAARVFGYDVFVSFALGPPPRGTRSYASDLARRLRERDFTVFFSEEEAPVGDRLDATLTRALHRSRILVVIVNSGSLADPRWLRVEVEEFRRKHPERPVIPINIGGALQDATLAAAAEPWLRFSDKIWLDESQSAGDEGVVSDGVIERLLTAPNAIRSRTRWRWTVRAAFAVLMIVTASALWFAWSDRQHARQADRSAAEAQDNAARADKNAADARREGNRAIKAEGQARDEADAARLAQGQATASARIAQDERQISDARRQLTEASLLGGEAARVPMDWARLTKQALAQAVAGAADLRDRGDPYPLERNERLRELVRRMPGSVRELDLSSDVTGLLYSRDGNTLFVGGHGLFRDGEFRSKLPEGGVSDSLKSVIDDDLSVIGGIGTDHALRLWSLATGRELPRTWDATVKDASLSPTGRMVATMDANRLVTVRDVATGRTVMRHQLGPYDDDLKIVFSDDETRALLAADEAPLLIDLVTGGEQPVPKAPGEFDGADFSDDGSAMAFITSCRVFVFDAATFAQRMMTETEDCEDVDWENIFVRLASDARRVTVVRSHLSPSTYEVPSGEVVWPRNVLGIWATDTTYHGVTPDAAAVVRYEGDALTMFSTETGEVLARVMAPQEPTAFAIDFVHRQVALAYGHRLLIFQSLGGDQLHEEANPAVVRALARSDDGRRLLIATDRDLAVWSSGQGCVYRAAIPAQEVWMSADGRLAAWTAKDEVAFVRVNDGGDATVLPAFKPSHPTTSVRLTNDGLHAILSGPDHALVRELSSGRTVFEESDPKISVDVDPSSRILAIASDREPGTIRFTRLGGREPGETVSLPTEWRSVTPVVGFTATGRYVVVAVSEKDGLLYDRIGHAFTSLPPSAMSEDYDPQFFAGDRYLLITRRDNGSGSNEITPAIVWDVRTMQRVMSIDIEDAPSAMAVDPGGTLVAVAGLRHDKNTITLFDLARRRETMQIPSAEKISFLLFSDDGSHLASAGDRGLLRVRNIDRQRWTAVEQARLPHDRSVVYAAFSRDGQTLMSIESDRADGYRTHFWRWSSEALLAHARLCLRLFTK